VGSFAINSYRYFPPKPQHKTTLVIISFPLSHFHSITFPHFSAPSHLMAIPVIDFSKLNGEERAKTMAQIANGCEEWGFFQVLTYTVYVSKNGSYDV